MDYVEKIKNLLDLAESPNEFEARDALLAARRLMAKYKVSEEALHDVEKEEVVREHTGIDYSARRDPWIPALANTIAKNHCCKNFQVRAKGKQVAEICFVGLSSDLPICKEVFLYAVDCVRSVTNKLRKSGTSVADGYGYGFVVGLDDAYKKQQTEEGWGLVLVVPQAVEDSMKKVPVKTNPTLQKKMASSNGKAYYKGIIDGRKFKEQKRIGGE